MEKTVTKTETSEAGLDKRRSSRVVYAYPIKVEGVDALGDAFTENTNTVMVNCHGCKYQSKHYVPKGSIVTVEISRHDRAAAPRILAGKVIWVQRPAQAREILHIGVEFPAPGSVWDIPNPPADWFPLEGEELFSLPVAEAVPEFPVSAAADVETLTWDESEIQAMGAVEAKALEEKAQRALAPSSVANELETVAAETLAFEVSDVSDESAESGPGAGDSVARGDVEQAVRSAIERLSHTAVNRIVQEATERSSQIAEEAQKIIEAADEHFAAKLDAMLKERLDAALDEKIKKAVAEAVSKTPDNHKPGKKHRK